MTWTDRSRRTSTQLAEARRLESTGRKSDARRAQALCWAVAVDHDDMAWRWADRWGSRAVPIEDRRQTARMGMYDAACKYDPNRGVPFAGHAKWWVRARLTRAHPEYDLPSNQQEHLRLLARVDEMGLTEAQAAERLGRTVEQMRTTRAAGVHARPASLDTPLTHAVGEDRTIGERIADPTEPRYADASDVERVVRAIDSLPERQRIVLRLLYGLETGEPVTLALAAELLGISRQRVGQIEARALHAVRVDMRVVDDRPETAADRLVEHVAAHPGCSLRSASRATGVDAKTAEHMAHRLGLTVRCVGVARALYLPGAAGGEP